MESALEEDVRSAQALRSCGFECFENKRAMGPQRREQVDDRWRGSQGLDQVDLGGQVQDVES